MSTTVPVVVPQIGDHWTWHLRLGIASR